MHKAPDHDRTQKLRRTAETAGQSGPHEIYDWQTSRRFNRKADYYAKSRAKSDQSVEQCYRDPHFCEARVSRKYPPRCKTVARKAAI